jgi:hypothetical protein
MEESLCNVEFLKNNNTFVARVQSELGGLREYQSANLEEVLEQVIIDLQEEFDTSMWRLSCSVQGYQGSFCRWPYFGGAEVQETEKKGVELVLSNTYGDDHIAAIIHLKVDTKDSDSIAFS